jgi:hypothetical protein
MAPGSFIVGLFAQSTILFLREVLTIEIAFQNEDDFVRNLICLRGELRSGLAVPVPAGGISQGDRVGEPAVVIGNGTFHKR